jgi:hypothetical protein
MRIVSFRIRTFANGITILPIIVGLPVNRYVMDLTINSDFRKLLKDFIAFLASIAKLQNIQMIAYRAALRVRWES